MPTLPDAVLSLRDHPDLEARLGWIWPDEEEAQQAREDCLAWWAQNPYDEAFSAACHARIARSTFFAIGALRTRWDAGSTDGVLFFYDPETPGRVAFGFSPPFPPLLWGSAPIEAGGLLAALAPYLVDEAPAVPAYPRTLRLLLGYPMDTLEPILQTLAGTEPWVDDGWWGSHWDDDPWPERANAGAFRRAAILRDSARQGRGRLESFSVRTQWSRSLLRVERHRRGDVVFEARYAPVTDGGAVARTMAALGGGSGLPIDLPLDLAASLLRGPHDGIAAGAAPDDWPIESPGDVALWCALFPESTAADVILRRAAERWREDPEAVAFVAQTALERGHLATLHEIALTTPHAELRERIEAALTLAPAAPAEVTS